MTIIIGASLSEPHIDELNVRNLYIIIIIIYYYYWGEPERAPHRRVERSQSIYYLLLSLLWYVRHPRAAIEIVQEYAIYSNTT